MRREQLNAFSGRYSDYDRVISATGKLVNTVNGISVEINTSSILTRLIQEVGRLCDHYASDLFIDWSDLMDKLASFNGVDNMVYLFGIREDGVDSAQSVIYNHEKGDTRTYRAIWRLDVDINPSSDDRWDVEMCLYRVRA